LIAARDCFKTEVVTREIGPDLFIQQEIMITDTMSQGEVVVLLME
jgi:hypothetical protein